MVKSERGGRVVSDTTLIDEETWASFVRSHPEGNIFHSPAMVGLYESAGIEKPVILFYIGLDGAIEGVISAFILGEGSPIISWLSSRAIVWGGPLVRDNRKDVYEALLTALLTKLRGKVTYIQVRNLTDTSAESYLFQKCGFLYDEHLNILFDLKKSESQLWNELHPTRRKQIKRAERRDVTTVFHEKAGETVIKACYDILVSVYQKAGLPLPEFSFFLKASSLHSEREGFRVVTAHSENRIIGFRFILLFRGVLYDWYAGSDERYHDKYPNDVLPWEIIKWGHEQGYSTFDFGGAGHPREKYGVRDYKMKFGGLVVNYGRYTFVHRPWVYYPAKMFMKLKTRLFR